ncbi:MAG: hypothetical protein ACOYOS_12260 [Syntrophales bacterium]
MKCNQNAAAVISEVTSKLNKFKNLHSSISATLYARCLEIEIESGGNNPRYRYQFNSPDPDVLDLYETLKLDQTKVGKLFWAVDDPYADILLTLTAAGLKIQDELMARTAFFLILARLWNRAVDKDIPEGIDHAVMREAMEKHMTLQNPLKKHKTPFYLLTDHLLPKQLDQFRNGVVSDPARVTNLLYTDTCRQIEHLFRGNYIMLNIKAKTRRYFTGIEPFYRQMEAELMKAAA